MKKTIVIGKVNSSKVVLEIELRKKKVREGLHITTDWKALPIGSEYFELSICGNCRTRGSGQISDIIDEMTEFDLPEYEIKMLFDYWKKWHLNGLNAASNEQQELIDIWKSNPAYKHYGQFNDYHDQLNHILKQHSLNPDSHGYTYGSRWLIKTLPHEVIEYIDTLPNHTADQARSELLEWMIANGVTWKVTPALSNPFITDQQMDHWRYTFESDGESMSFIYSTGIGHRIPSNDPYNNRIFKHNAIRLRRWKFKMYHLLLGTEGPHGGIYQLSKMLDRNSFRANTGMDWVANQDGTYSISTPPDEVLATLLNDTWMVENYADHFEFANELGYDINDRREYAKVLRIWAALIEQKTDLHCLLGSDFEHVRELANGLN